MVVNRDTGPLRRKGKVKPETNNVKLLTMVCLRLNF